MLFMENSEFTYFAYQVFKTFKNATEEIEQFILDHDRDEQVIAIYAFEATNDEIRDWFMYHCPFAYDCYSGYDVFEKSGAYALLKNRVPLTEKQFHEISSMLAEFDLDCEWSPALLHYKDYEELVDDYLDEVERMPLELSDLKGLAQVYIVMEAIKNEPLLKKCQNLVDGKKVRDVLADALGHTNGYGVARRFHIPYEKAMAEAISSHWDEYFYRGEEFYVNHPEALEYIIPMVREEMEVHHNYVPFMLIADGLHDRLDFCKDLVQEALESGDDGAVNEARWVLSNWQDIREGKHIFVRLGFDY